MKFIRFAVIMIFLSPAVFCSCKKDSSLPDPKPILLTAKARQVVIADNRLGLELFAALADTGNAQNNLMISPLSISQALCMTYNGAAGDTKTAFDSTMHFENLSVTEINESSKTLRGELLSVDGKVTVSIANSIWYREGFPVKKEFVQTNRTYYDAEVKALDFDNQQSVDIINNWVDDQTRGKISKIVETLNPLDRMLLIDAVYFKGDWRNKFDKALTQTAPFYLENGQTVNVQMMQTTGSYGYFENDMLDALEMAYGRGNFSMVVLLPKTDYRVRDILDTLISEVWSDWEERFVFDDDIPVTFPKFEFKYEKPLRGVLSDLGLAQAFADDADFGGISDSEKLHISSVMHKTYIKVDEEGTEAAAVTSVTVGTTSVGPGKPFVADHPFVFLIREKYTHAILFAGVVANPS